MTARRRFPVDSLPGEAPVALDAAASHHLLRVLRLGPGARVEAFDGDGAVCEAEVAAIEDGRALLAARGPTRRAAPPHPSWLLLGQSRPKALDPALRMAVEAGVSHLEVWRAARSLPRPPRLERWARIATSAAQQCGRADAPQVRWHEDLPAALAVVDPQALSYVAVPGAAPLPRPTGPSAVVVGPEGGLTPDEVTRVLDAGGRPVGLGRWVLRAETAACLAAAFVAP